MVLVQKPGKKIKTRWLCLRYLLKRKLASHGLNQHVDPEKANHLISPLSKIYSFFCGYLGLIRYLINIEGLFPCRPSRQNSGLMYRFILGRWQFFLKKYGFFTLKNSLRFKSRSLEYINIIIIKQYWVKCVKWSWTGGGNFDRCRD